MKRTLLLLLALFVAVLMAGCEKDGTSTENNPFGTNIDDYIQDPPGTITINMVNSEYYDLGLGGDCWLYFRQDNNFWMPYSGEITNVGNVNGLGAITKIPAGAAFTDLTATIPGYGYIVRKSTGESQYIYARIYVVDWMSNGSYSGVTIKYQAPWEPK